MVIHTFTQNLSSRLSGTHALRDYPHVARGTRDTHTSAHTPRKQAMAQDGSQPPAWTGQAFPFLPKLVAGEFLAWRAGAQKSC